ncbi:uncharacterized protein LACBIDRAFT_304572 [Laccaria bicolor S238N-H82]|uniref:Predicted protein n=1 Tax=Laccaria bicolor (strain S238N-H82 / ATCC MYA-4686) TaxID=486041 RepID=B0DLX6_LACBS|nr:uncharacterized protein LACBIDRAFT_304572 [Laccaria bicolor S238N-H82]EDR04472.1 predicted protein [Laccaria bicolor S238N-H82]|eukprot:XP_001884991.1 predicted protein [Laccaria bicolor S238N-H82]
MRLFVRNSTAGPVTTTEIKPLCKHKIGGRNLIVCIDGTANQFGDKNTNVIELYHRILKEVKDNQKTWYNSGIGTYARPSWKSFKFYRQVLSHKIDLAIAWNFERTVLGAYRWLSDNYEPGDCIFLFGALEQYVICLSVDAEGSTGFSRGAFQVRVLSAMIDKVGLIHKGNEMQIPFAYELYADPKSDDEELSPVTQAGSPPEKKLKSSAAERFKRTFSNKVRVHFVGAWDTVSSIGIAREKKMLLGTVDRMKHVCFFRHALALDERRVKFLPEYAYGGSVTGETTQYISPSDGVDHSKGMDKVHPQTLEVWFAGTHSDIQT